eukprot:GHVP01043876.1.p1 GENE.GHVP01043876.1~~GHVP01043876.1.p1  ORF type:complete len:239 (-),score=46.36 GHVP01043876.1:36-752(-)
MLTKTTVLNLENLFLPQIQHLQDPFGRRNINFLLHRHKWKNTLPEFSDSQKSHEVSGKPNKSFFVVSAEKSISLADKNQKKKTEEKEKREKILPKISKIKIYAEKEIQTDATIKNSKISYFQSTASRDNYNPSRDNYNPPRKNSGYEPPRDNICTSPTPPGRNYTVPKLPSPKNPPGTAPVSKIVPMPSMRPHLKTLMAFPQPMTSGPFVFPRPVLRPTKPVISARPPNLWTKRYRKI